MEKSKKQAEQLNEQLVNGKISINDARKVLGLKPIENADEKFTKDKSYNNKLL